MALMIAQGPSEIERRQRKGIAGHKIADSKVLILLIPPTPFNLLIEAHSKVLRSGILNNVAIASVHAIIRPWLQRQQHHDIDQSGSRLTRPA